ncbi:MAG: hypothetical protein ACREUS_14995 [Burkholderiales bacterium]
MAYTLTLERKPAYLHAIVTSENTKENVARYLADIRRRSPTSTSTPATT